MKLSYWFILSYLAAVTFFVLGLLFPIFSTKWAIDIWGWYTNEVYLINSLIWFFEKGDVFLGCIIILFTLLVPTVKFIIYAMYIASKFRAAPVNKLISHINKWSMLDVLILALMLLYMRSTSFWVKMQIHQGTYFFTLSVICLGICSTLLMLNENRSNNF